MSSPNRRLKFDKYLQDAFCDLLKEGVGRTAACKKLNIARSTFNRCLNSNQKFNEAVHAAEMDANEVIEMALFSTAKKGNVTAQQVWLYNRSPERWQDQRNALALERFEFEKNEYEKLKAEVEELKEKLGQS